MPESLKMTSGRIENETISLYLTSINPYTSYFGADKLSTEQFAEIQNKMSAVQNTANTTQL
jgi:hypothetical protein